jgi:hypothetical protein
MKYTGLLSHAVEEGLQALGELPKEAIYKQLETGFSMPKAEIPSRFSEFSGILRDNIGPSAEPLLEFIIDRFCHEVQMESIPCADLDESISRVDLILKGDLAPSNQSDHASHLEPAQPGSKANDETCDSIQLTRNQINPSGTMKSVAMTTAFQQQNKEMSRKTASRRSSKPNSGA